MKDIQSALGNINNFEVVYIEETNTIHVIDSTIIPGIETAFASDYTGVEPFIINATGTVGGSFVRDAKIQSKLSNAFASQTTISAQSNG